jgi:small subunit ribosomal protein S15
MTLTKQKKTKVIETSKIHEKDTGSPEVQIALFTEKIKSLTSHLKKNKKDNHSRRGLLKMVSKRKKLSNYLKKSDPKRYKKLASSLGLKE